MSVIPLYKNLGETPLETIKRFKSKNQKYKDEPMSYAGRLDPMAEGVLLVLLGDELTRKDTYQKLNKTYVAEILFDVESDTYDILGVIHNTKNVTISDSDLNTKLTEMTGALCITLPPFSSYRIGGKPLFWWAKEKRIHEIEIPKRTVTIFSASLESFQKKCGREIRDEAVKKINLVSGDFRQKEIIDSWNTFDIHKTYTVARISYTCSSGTYIRSLATILGEKLNTTAILFNLKRTAVGNYSLSDCLP